MINSFIKFFRYLVNVVFINVMDEIFWKIAFLCCLNKQFDWPAIFIVKFSLTILKLIFKNFFCFSRPIDAMFFSPFDKFRYFFRIAISHEANKIIKIFFVIIVANIISNAFTIISIGNPCNFSCDPF